MKRSHFQFIIQHSETMTCWLRYKLFTAGLTELFEHYFQCWLYCCCVNNAFLCIPTSLLWDEEPGESSCRPPTCFCSLPTNRKHSYCLIQQRLILNKFHAQKKTHLPLRDDRGLIWRRDCAPPHGTLWGAAENSSPLGPALLRGLRWWIVIVSRGGRVPIAITLLGQRLHLLP